MSELDYKDENVWLMFGDCLERMKEIPCLPVHDSFIVQKQHIDLLCDTMGEKFRERFNTKDPVPVGIKWKDDEGCVVEVKNECEKELPSNGKLENEPP